MGNLEISKKTIIGIVFAFVALLFLFCLPKIGEDVKNEQIVVNQAPFTGRMSYWTEPGFHWQWFGNITSYYKTQQLWFGSSDDSGDQQGSPIPVIFNDASDGMIYGSLRVKLPTDQEHLSRIQTDYNGMGRLMNDLVKQTVTKVVYASGPLMSAFESYAEKKNDLIEYIMDQLANGVYKTTVNKVETIDPVTGEVKVVKMAALIADSDAPGGYKRSESSPFKYYGIEIGQVSISKIAYSDKVNQQIAQQQEANMLIQTSKAKSAAAQQEAIRAEEEGKAVAAKARWEQEKIKAVEVTKAEQEKEVARLAAEKANYEKAKIIAEGQAEAEAARLKVAAGLSPSEKAEWEYKTKVGVAEALAKSNVSWVPTVMYTGNGGSAGSSMDAVGLKMMLDVVDKVSKK